MRPFPCAAARFVLGRRVDAVAVIWGRCWHAPGDRVGAGSPRRRGRPASTVRGRLARFAAHAEPIRVGFALLERRANAGEPRPGVAGREVRAHGRPRRTRVEPGPLTEAAPVGLGAPRPAVGTGQGGAVGEVVPGPCDAGTPPRRPPPPPPRAAARSRSETSCELPASTPSICSRVFATSSAGPRSSVVAYRAPSDAAEVKMLRTCSTSATSAKPATADPRSPRRRRTVSRGRSAAGRCAPSPGVGSAQPSRSRVTTAEPTAPTTGRSGEPGTVSGRSIGARTRTTTRSASTWTS